MSSSDGGGEPKVLVEQRGHVLLVTLNRPAARNAVDAECCEIVGAAVERAEADDDVRALVVTGAGTQSFSAGADLKAAARGERLLPEGKEHWSFASFANHWTSVPTIAAVNGTALGGGFELALSCDLIVSCESAVFGLPEVKRGLFAAAGGPFRVIEQLPRKVAMHMLLTGEPITAAEALRWGLVNEVVPDGTVVDAALALAEVIAGNAPLSVQASKRLAYGALDGVRLSEQDLWAMNDKEMVTVFSSQDAQEGPRAFAEKRPPIWSAR